MAQLGSNIQAIAAESGRASGSAMKGAGEGEGDGMAELFKVNQIWYRSPPTLSLASKRTLLVNCAQRSTYTNLATDSISIIFNSGELYVNCASSYLYLKLGYNNPTLYKRSKALISQGNALSLFEEIHLLSASGTEICREQQKGLREAYKYYYTNTQEYLNTYGQAQGGTYGSYSAIHDGTGPSFGYTIGQTAQYNMNEKFPALDGTEGTIRPVSGEAAKNYWGHGVTNLNKSSMNISSGYTSPALDYVEVVIPMVDLLGCFKPYMNALFPAGALAGARLELRFKNPTESLQFVAGIKESASADPDPGDTDFAKLAGNPYNNFVVSNVYMVLDAFQLQDSVLQILNQVAAGEQGIAVMFDTYDHTSLLVQGQGTVEAQVQQARSRISKSWCVVRDNANLSNPYIPSFASEGVIRRVAASIPAGRPAYPDQKFMDNGGTVTYNFTGNPGSMNALYRLNYDEKSSDEDKYVPVFNVSLDPIMVRSAFSPAEPWGSDYGKPVVTSYQAQLGSLFFPQQPLTTPVEYYTNALYMWGKSTPDRSNNCAVTYQDFLGGLGYGLYSNGAPVDPTKNNSMGKMIFPYGLACYGMLAEKSSLLQLSGLPLCNSRLLRHKFTFATNPQSGTSRIIDVFTDFTRMFKLFLGGRVVVRE